MVMCLYLMAICFCAYSVMPQEGLGDYSLIALFLGVIFFWIANCCYDNTISKLKNEIKDLKKEIDHIKE